MNKHITVTHYSLLRGNAVRRDPTTSFYSSRELTEEFFMEKSQDYTGTFLGFTIREDNETFYVQQGVGLLGSEQELIANMIEELAEKRASLTERQDAYINQVKATLAELIANGQTLNIFSVTENIGGASASNDPAKGVITISQHFTMLPILYVNETDGSILEVFDVYVGVSY